jgi:hypothetical protein
VTEVCEALVEKLKGFVQVRQILLFVVYERNLKLDFHLNFYLNTNFTETFIFKNRPNFSANTRVFRLVFFFWLLAGPYHHLLLSHLYYVSRTVKKIQQNC